MGASKYDLDQTRDILCGHFAKVGLQVFSTLRDSPLSHFLDLSICTCLWFLLGVQMQTIRSHEQAQENAELWGQLQHSTKELQAKDKDTKELQAKDKELVSVASGPLCGYDSSGQTGKMSC